MDVVGSMTILTQKEVNGYSDGVPLALGQERLQNTSATTEHILAAGGERPGRWISRRPISK